MAVSQFRRSIVSDTKQRPRTPRSGSSGGPNRANWFDKMKLPVGTPTPIAFVSGEYIDPKPHQDEIQIDPTTGQPRPVMKPYKKVKNHRRRLMENGREWYADVQCSAGWDPHNPQPCAGCTAMEMGDKSVTLQEKFLFTLVHLAQYHGHPYQDRQTGEWAKRQDGQYTLNYTECSGNSCKFCRVLRGQPVSSMPNEPQFPNYPQGSITTLFGRRKYLEIGKGHLENLDAWDDRVKSKCANVVNGRTCGTLLEKEGFACPECHDFLIDLKAEGETRTYEQAAQQVMSPYPCQACQKMVLAYEVRNCQHCNEETKTNNLWGTLLVARRTGEGKNSVLTLDDPYSFEDYEPVVKQWLGGKTLRSVFEELGVPYDFDTMLTSKGWDDQCRKLKLNLPAPGGAQQQQQPSYVAYAPPQAPGFATGGPGPAPFQPPIRPNFSK